MVIGIIVLNGLLFRLFVLWTDELFALYLVTCISSHCYSFVGWIFLGCAERICSDYDYFYQLIHRFILILWNKFIMMVISCVHKWTSVVLNERMTVVVIFSSFHWLLDWSMLIWSNGCYIHDFIGGSVSRGARMIERISEPNTHLIKPAEDDSFRFLKTKIRNHKGAWK
jgi:hypothetical protein